MRSEILASIPCAYFYGECHKYPLESCLVCRAALPRPHRTDLCHVPASLSPPACDRDTRARGVRQEPESFIIFIFCMKRGVCCCAPGRTDPPFGQKLFWSFVHLPSGSALAQTRFPKHSLYISLGSNVLNLNQTNFTKLREPKEKSRKKNNFKGCVS